MKAIVFLIFFIYAFPGFSQWTGPDAANKIYYSKGFVGVGILPSYRFHLKTTDQNPLVFAETAEAEMSFARNGLEFRAKPTALQTPFISWNSPNGKRQATFGARTDAFGLKLENGYSFFINGGNVGIGVDDTKGYQLAVGGKIVAEEIVVKLKTVWPDYVFTEAYPLVPIRELSTFIQKHKHLPEIPSAEQVKNDGINLNEISTLLLKKVEELTLYVIEERKYAETLQRRIDSLETIIESQHK